MCSCTQIVPTHRRYDARVHDGFTKLLEVSAYLDFPFTLEEVARYFLPKVNISPTELGSVLSGEQFADLRFMLKDGYIFAGSKQTIGSRGVREHISAAKLGAATEFANLLSRLVPFIRTIAVTGSVAYGSANKWDDIDLFVVTERKRLWISALLMLVQLRLCKLLHLRPQHLLPFCLSYVHDAEGFSRESRRNRKNSLFARELLKAKPVAGAEAYRELLRENAWVREYYSTAYSEKVKMLGGDSDGVSTRGASAPREFFLDWVEAFTYELLSRYLRLRAYLTNLKLESEGKNLRIFDPVISAGSCVFTSNFYRWLSDLWRE